jgi:hypothetical protein
MRAVLGQKGDIEHLQQNSNIISLALLPQQVKMREDCEE